MILRVTALLVASVVATSSALAAPLPEILASAFAPPPEMANDFGSYRSPLVFRDGSPVRTATDVLRRQREIREEWMSLMGPWPPLIEQPSVEILSTERRENFTQQRIRFAISPGQLSEAWLLIPDGKAPHPAVVVPFYDPETSIGLGKGPFRDFAYQLTRRGFVTLSIGSPGGDARKPDRGSATCQPLSYLAYVAANCWHVLASRPEVDSKRIGITGHSYGGKWAMFASCLFPRFACAAWSDPGIVFEEKRASVNYWEPWYLGLDPAITRKPGLITPESPRTGVYRQLVESGHDLHELHLLMVPRPFLVSGGAEDPVIRWRALNHSLAACRLMGMRHRIAMTNRPEHSPDEQSNAQLYAFFEHFLTPAAPPR